MENHEWVDLPHFHEQASSKPGRCPFCCSSQVKQHCYGKTTGAALGGAAGAVAAAGNLLDEDTDFVGVCAAILAGLAGALTGVAAGAALGEAVDDVIFGDYECFECGKSFHHPAFKKGD